MKRFVRSLLRAFFRIDRYLPRWKVLAWGWLALLSVIGSLMFLTLNVTHSLPPGLYATYPKPEALDRGEFVLFCPSPPTAKFGQKRDYVAGGFFMNSEPTCGNTVPFLKEIRGRPGDTMRVDFEGVWQNGEKIGPPPPHCDSKGRPIPVRYGRHVLRNGQYWIGGKSYLSFDSRVYGPIHKSQVLSRAVSVLTRPLDMISPAIKSPSFRHRRADCDTEVQAGAPLLDQVDLISQTESLDSLHRRVRQDSFQVQYKLTPSLSLLDELFPSWESHSFKKTRQPLFLSPEKN